MLKKMDSKKKPKKQAVRALYQPLVPPSLLSSFTEFGLVDSLCQLVAQEEEREGRRMWESEVEVENRIRSHISEIGSFFDSLDGQKENGNGKGEEGEEEGEEEFSSSSDDGREEMSEEEESGDCISITKVRSAKSRRQFYLKYTVSLLYCRWRAFVSPLQPTIAETFYSQIGLGKGEKDSSSLCYENLNRLLFGSYRKGDRRVGLWTKVDRQSDGTLRCAYTNELLETAEGKRLKKCDEEHLVPQSWHKGSRTHPGQDMHAIFVVSKTANGTRGNAVFGVKDEIEPLKKYGGLIYQEKGSPHYFCPYHNVGAVCRATLYILVCYRETFHLSYFPKASLTWIIERAIKEEVTDWERHRNQELHLLQGTRNPFIDHPEWASKIDFSAAFVPS